MPDFDIAMKALQLPSPVTEIFTKQLAQKNLSLFIKREDLIHPEISGNKWRKLYLNLLQASTQGRKTILTFGGAYSNHIYATAAACRLLGFESIGVIRGEQIDDQNSTLTFAQANGMKIVPVSRGRYKNDKESIAQEYPEAYCVPEGGNNELGRNGMKILVDELKQDFPNQKVKLLVPIGTGCTIGGLINFLPDNFSVIGINVLKNLGIDVELKSWIEREPCDYEVNHEFHFGGYAKANQVLVDFINSFYSEHAIQLDPIYTSKMLFAITDLIKKDYFSENDTIVALHTGGLQGINGFNQRYSKKYGAIK